MPLRASNQCNVAILLLVLCPHVFATEQVTSYSNHLDLLHYLDEKGAKQPVRTAADWAHRRAHVLQNMQLVTGPLPDRSRAVPLDVKVEAEERIGTLLRRKLTFRSEPDDRVPAHLFIPPLKENEKAPAFLCLHQTTKIGKAEPAGLGPKTNLQYALELANRGYVTLAPDYPSFGDHPYDFAAHPQWRSGTMKAIWDNTRAIDLLQSLPQVDGNRIGAIGHSLGGHNAIFTAVFDDRIKAIVTSCGFTRFHKYYNGNLKGWTSDRYMPRIASVYGNDPNKVPFDFPDLLAAIAPRAIFVNAPLHDANFEVSGVKDSITAAEHIYKLFDATDDLKAIYPDAAHDFPPNAREQAYLFLDRHLLQEPRATNARPQRQ